MQTKTRYSHSNLKQLNEENTRRIPFDKSYRKCKWSETFSQIVDNVLYKQNNEAIEIKPRVRNTLPLYRSCLIISS